MSRIKEPQFFAADIFCDQRTVQTLADYLSCFAAARNEKRIGEASTAYLGSRNAAQEIKAFNPNAQIIISVAQSGGSNVRGAQRTCVLQCGTHPQLQCCSGFVRTEDVADGAV